MTSLFLAYLIAGSLAQAGSLERQTQIQKQCLQGAGNQSSQRKELCKAALAEDAAAFVQDNNSRVWTPVAVVCGFTCLSQMTGSGGSGSSCSSAQISGRADGDANYQNFRSQMSKSLQAPSVNGSKSSGPSGGGDPCSSALNSGFYAYDSNKAYRQETSAYNVNFENILQLQKNTGAPNLDRKSSPDDKFDVGGLSDACQRARDSLSAKDRMDCALNTDSKIPAFVKSPKFQKEFQEMTGRSLESVINKSTTQLYNEDGPAVFQKAYAQVKGKLSLMQFVGLGSSLARVIYGGLATPEDKDYFLSAFVPNQVRGFLPQSSKVKSVQGVGSSLPNAKASQIPDKNGGYDSIPETSGSLGPESSKVLPVNNPKFGLFYRVSRRYQKVQKRLSWFDSHP